MIIMEIWDYNINVSDTNAMNIIQNREHIQPRYSM